MIGVGNGPLLTRQESKVNEAREVDGALSAPWQPNARQRLISFLFHEETAIGSDNE